MRFTLEVDDPNDNTLDYAFKLKMCHLFSLEISVVTDSNSDGPPPYTSGGSESG